MLLGERVGAGEKRLGLRAIVGGDAAREEPCIDAEPEREPVDRLLRRAGLPALDLGDVFLREPVAGEVGLRETGGDSKLPDPLAQTRRAGGKRSRGLDRVRHHDSSE